MYNPEKIILIGGSAGSFKIVTGVIVILPSDFKYPVILSLHRLRNIRNGFVRVLSVGSAIKIKEPYDNEIIRSGRVYVSPSNYHMMIEPGNRISLSVDESVNHSRPSIDVLFETAAEVYRERCVGVLLSGANSDGAKGMFKIKEAGGITIVQDPADAEIPSMPTSCLNLITPDYILSADKIIKFISNLHS